VARNSSGVSSPMTSRPTVSISRVGSRSAFSLSRTFTLGVAESLSVRIGISADTVGWARVIMGLSPAARSCAWKKGKSSGKYLALRITEASSSCIGIGHASLYLFSGSSRGFD